MTLNGIARGTEITSLLGKLIKFGVVGSVVTGVHAVVLAILVDYFGWNPVYATFIAFVVAFTTSYILNSFWTFNATPHCKAYFVKFFAVAIIGLALNVIIMYISTEIFLVDYRIGFLLSIFIVPFISFLLNYFWTFT